MTQYYGDDMDLGDRMEADQMTASFEELGNAWARYESMSKHVATLHAEPQQADMPAILARDTSDPRDAYSDLKARHRIMHGPAYVKTSAQVIQELATGQTHRHKWQGTA